jgi:hypothetical protein|tara:strand:+ start:1008 stop:1325 length:318 start_codon:yes stop_codon:yes gene_type:complete
VPAGGGVMGIARGGGSLAWQLGHNDLADQQNLSAYMGAHVTLTGLRGAFVPFLGIVAYLGWDARAWLPGFDAIGAYVFVFSALLSAVSWWGFERLHKRMGPRQAI